MLSAIDVDLRMKGDGDFTGVFALNRLPNIVPPQPKVIKMIINTDCDNLPGTYWIAVMRHASGDGEIFDSFGLYPPARVQLWCNRHATRWKHNTLCIQKVTSTLCGVYCCMFLFSRSRFNSINACIAYLSHIV